MTLLIVTYPVNNNALTSLFIACQTLNLSCSIVVISHHFTVRISHRLHPIPAVIRSTIDISPDIRHARHDRTDSLCHLTLLAVVIRFTTRSILNEGKTTGTVILIASLTIGISNTVEEIFGIKHLVQPFEVVGVRDVTLVRYRLPKFCRELRQEVACRIVSHVIDRRLVTVICCQRKCTTANIQLYFVNGSFEYGKTRKDEGCCACKYNQEKSIKTPN